MFKSISNECVQQPVRCQFKHSKINSISPSAHVLFCWLYKRKTTFMNYSSKYTILWNDDNRHVWKLLQFWTCANKRFLSGQNSLTHFVAQRWATTRSFHSLLSAISAAISLASNAPVSLLRVSIEVVFGLPLPWWPCVGSHRTNLNKIIKYHGLYNEV